jgi:hypothetical protein
VFILTIALDTFELRFSPSGTQGVVALLLIATIIYLVLLYRVMRAGFNKRTSLPPMDFPAWDPQNDWTSLQKLLDVTLTQGESAIGWYRDNVRSKRVGSRVLRSMAITLASIGALLPLFAAVANRFEQEHTRAPLVDAQWGYIAFATAAACVAADKFYGFSTGWIRYMKTQLVLESALTSLRYDWIALIARVANQQPTGDQIQAMLQKLKEFAMFVRSQVEQETEAWVLEFQTNLADLASTVKTRAEATKPGSLQITVTNAKEFDAGIKALLDHTEERAIEGASCLFTSVSPGSHEILVRGRKGSQVFEAAAVAKVVSDSLVSLNVALPTP